MRIIFERTGGFTGMRISTTIDTDSLSPEEAARVRDMVRAAALPDAKPDSEPSTGRPDEHGYRITVVEEGKTSAISVQERDVTPELRPLLDLLVAAAKRAQRRGPH